MCIVLIQLGYEFLPIKINKHVPKFIVNNKINIMKNISLFSSITLFLNNKLDRPDKAVLSSEKHLNIFIELIKNNR